MLEAKVISTIVTQYTPLSKACQRELLTHLELKIIPKNTILVREGQYADRAYLVIQGCIRSYYLKDGRDISDWFAFEHEFISPIVSFFGDGPSPHYLATLEDSIIAEISRSSMEKLANIHHDFERLIRTVVTRTVLQQREKMAALLFQSAREKYERMLEIRPDITNRVPLMHIASYLGITLETLSRIRNPKR